MIVCPHDFIHLEFRNCDKYLEKVSELYKQGRSLHAVAKIVDLSKTKVRDLIIRAGVRLRSLRIEKGNLVIGSRKKMEAKLRLLVS